MELDTSVHGVTELRVHGVSGTPPEQMLDHPAELVRRVSGDRSAGCYRRWYPGGSTHDQPDRRHLEAYAWGRLTSGAASRAAWLLLVPFTLVNLAHWMLPAVRPGQRSRHAVAVAAAGLLRLLGLSLTLTLLLATAFVTMDLGAWQCASLPSCTQDSGPLRVVAALDRGPRLALAALLPALLVLLLWKLGAQQLRPSTVLPPPSPAVPVGARPLADPSFWTGDPSTVRLRAVHVAAWAATLGVLALAGPSRYATGTWQALAGILLLFDGLLLLGCLVAASSNRLTGRGGSGAHGADQPLAALRWLALTLLAADLLVLAAAPAAYPAPPTHLPLLRALILGVFVVQVLLIVALAGCVAAQTPWRSGAADARPALLGFAAPVTAALGWLVAGAFSAGVGLYAAQYLGTAATTTATARRMLADRAALLADAAAPFAQRVTAYRAEAPLIVPPAYVWAGLGAVAVLLTAIVEVVVVLGVVRATTRRLTVPVAGEHPGEVAPQRVAQVARARALARLTDRVDAVVGPLVAVAALVVLVGLVSYLVGGYDLVERSQVARLTAVGTWLIGVAAAALVGLGFWAFRDARIRRTVGIVWDVATFWPRSNHPLTPPCYAERAVPELTDRVLTLTTAPGDVVVLSGHSQGSVLAAASVLQLPDPTRTALLTYGSPLRRLYARFFPAYLGPDTLRNVAERTAPCWRNLWAPSDPIGSFVLEPGGPVDTRLLDPVSLRPDASGALPPLVGHSGFLRRPEYLAAVDTLGHCRDARPPG